MSSPIPPHRPGPWDGRRGRRHRRTGAAGFVGCFAVSAIVVVGLFAAFATWVAGVILGVAAPSAAPSAATVIAVLVVIAVSGAWMARMVGRSIRPLGEMAAATRRLADGEPGVRVHARGPWPVRDLATSLNTMAERLDRSRDTRTSMLADVTHELRTPLTVVAGGIEAMLDGVHPMDEDHLAPLLAETGVMSRLLDDLRTLSLADAGALTLHREPTDLADLALSVVAAQAPLVAAKRIDLAAGGDAMLQADVDPVRVREIMTNLVANALRHTPAGGTVRLAVRADGERALIEVRDTGDGIPPDRIARIFDRYERHADIGGSGLGLTIVYNLAVAHGGTVTAESSGIPGDGARFVVVLPLRA
ncbi:MAG: HAMP domain-containing sensor histidine kinase [Chloroflexota bacterium]